MSTLPPPFVKEFSVESLEKKVYELVEKFAEFIPIQNDRYRLAYNLYKFKINEGDEPAISVKNTKIKIVKISDAELAEKINAALAVIGQ